MTRVPWISYSIHIFPPNSLPACVLLQSPLHAFIASSKHQIQPSINLSNVLAKFVMLF